MINYIQIAQHYFSQQKWNHFPSDTSSPSLAQPYNISQSQPQEPLKGFKYQQILSIFANESLFCQVLKKKAEFPQEIELFIWKLHSLIGEVIICVQNYLVQTYQLYDSIKLQSAHIDLIAHKMIESSANDRATQSQIAKRIHIKNILMQIYEQGIENNQRNAIQVYSYCVSICRPFVSFQLQISSKKQASSTQNHKQMHSRDISIPEQPLIWQISKDQIYRSPYKLPGRYVLPAQRSHYYQSQNIKCLDLKNNRIIDDIAIEGAPSEQDTHLNIQTPSIHIQKHNLSKLKTKNTYASPWQPIRIKTTAESKKAQASIPLTHLNNKNQYNKPKPVTELQSPQISTLMYQESPTLTPTQRPNNKSGSNFTSKQANHIQAADSAQVKKKLKWSSQEDSVLVKTYIEKGGLQQCVMALKEAYGESEKYLPEHIKYRIDLIVHRVFMKFASLQTKNQNILKFRDNKEFILRKSALAPRRKIYQDILVMYSSMLNMSEEKRELISKKIIDINHLCATQQQQQPN